MRQRWTLGASLPGRLLTEQSQRIYRYVWDYEAAFVFIARDGDT